jgi:RNA polymerase sigma factor (sigma-70 family)
VALSGLNAVMSTQPVNEPGSGPAADAPAASPRAERTGEGFAGASFRRYGPELRQYLLRRLHRRQDAEDVVQEVFMRLLRIKDYEFVRNPRAYIYGVTLHVARELRMRAERSGTWVTSDPQTIRELAEQPAELSPDELADQLNLQLQIERAVAKLPPMHQAVFVLNKRDGYSYEEIAGQLGLSANTVDKYLVQAKAWIRTMDWDR